MISCAGDFFGKSLENGAGIVKLDKRSLAVHRLFGSYYLSAECLSDGLMTEADAQNGELSGKMLYSLNGNACVLGIRGARRDDQCFGVR